MEKRQIALDERPEKRFVKIMMVIFGIVCIITAGWWAVYLFRSSEGDLSFQAATLFLLLFGAYQVYAGLGFASRYVMVDSETLVVRQVSLLPPVKLTKGTIDSITFRPTDIVIVKSDGNRFRLKLGIRYPEHGEKVKDFVASYAAEQGITVSDE